MEHANVEKSEPVGVIKRPNRIWFFIYRSEADNMAPVIQVVQRWLISLNISIFRFEKGPLNGVALLDFQGWRLKSSVLGNFNYVFLAFFNFCWLFYFGITFLLFLNFRPWLYRLNWDVIQYLNILRLLVIFRTEKHPFRLI